MGCVEDATVRFSAYSFDFYGLVVCFVPYLVDPFLLFLAHTLVLARLLFVRMLVFRNLKYSCES